MEWYPKRTFGDLPAGAAARFGEREALVFEGQRFTFAEVDREVDKAAKALMALGVGRGDHVALWLNNCADWVFICFAVLKIGAVLVPINTRFRARDMGYVLNQSDSCMLISHDRSGPVDYLAMISEAVDLPAGGERISDPAFPELNNIVILSAENHSGRVSWDTAKSGSDTISNAALTERAGSVDPDAPCLIMYTSGTTGHPKGVVHAHKLIRNIEERGYRMAVTPNDIILSYLPLFHAFGFSDGLMMAMITGAKQVITATFDPDECLDLIAHEKVTMAHGFEAHLKGLSDAQEQRPRDISSLRTGIFAAGMLSATPVARRGVKIMAPLRPVSGYGMTEVWLGVSLGSLDEDDKHRCESSGYPALGYEVRIVDPITGADCPVGEPGELITRGFSLMLGYYKKPEETAKCFDDDGWFHTGDTAIWLEDGYIRFLGRYKDMLKVGGENVDPMETEGLLLEHPGVHDVAVVGLPDERLSEVPVAFVQRAAGADLSAEDVIAYCRGAIASFKLPRHVIFLDQFPMTATGKIRKVDLRQTARRELLAESDHG